MNLSLRRLGLALVAVAVTGCGEPTRAVRPVTNSTGPVAKVPKNEAAHIRSLLSRLVDRGWLTGVVVGVHRDSGDTFVGAGRLEAGETATPDADTVFEIGSSTKVLTALLLADMVRRREVSLDDPVRSHLPASYRVPEKDGKLITLAHLASHTSGLPRMPPGFVPADPGDPYANFTEAQLRTALAATKLVTRPGEAYRYSNYGTGLLGVALAAVAAKPYERALAKRVLGPLGMSASGVNLPPSLAQRLARGHDADGRAVPAWHIPVLGGAGAVRSSTRDMLAFVRANLRLDRPAFAETMRLTHVPRHAAGNTAAAGHVGLGWHIDSAGVRWHNGATGGYRSFIAFDAKRRVAVVVLANTNTWLVDAIGKALLGPRPAAGYALDAPAPLAVGPAQLDRYVGRYRFAPTVAVEIAREGDGLTAQLTGQPAFRIYPESEHLFFLRAVKARLRFELDESGAVVRALLIQGGRTQPAVRQP